MSRRSQPERSKAVELREGEKECVGCFLPIHEDDKPRNPESPARWRDRRGHFTCRRAFGPWHRPAL